MATALWNVAKRGAIGVQPKWQIHDTYCKNSSLYVADSYAIWFCYGIPLVLRWSLKCASALFHDCTQALRARGFILNIMFSKCNPGPEMQCYLRDPGVR
jgi:hypothetical protein